MVLDRWRLVAGLRSEVADLEDLVRQAVPEADLETAEPAVHAALDIAFKVAASEATVLLRGESGTGKGVLARAIHGRSSRSGRPFVTVHCPSLSAELLESDLFGHAKGAFTGAVRDTEGKVAAAEGGTLFLDEVGDLPAAVQPKLLRFLQDKAYERVGETRTRSGDVRLIAATNRDLEAEVRAGRFREDLFYRLNVIEVTLPPLRERRPQHRAACRPPVIVLCPAGEPRSDRYSRRSAGRPWSAIAWPGNLRELRNVRRAGRNSVRRSGSRMSSDLPAQIGAPADDENRSGRIGHAGRIGGRAYPQGAGVGPDPRRRRRHSGHRPEHAVSQTETVRTVSRLRLSGRRLSRKRLKKHDSQPRHRLLFTLAPLLALLPPWAGPASRCSITSAARPT